MCQLILEEAMQHTYILSCEIVEEIPEMYNNRCNKVFYVLIISVDIQWGNHEMAVGNKAYLYNIFTSVLLWLNPC